MNLFILGSASWFKETINLLMLWLCDMLYRIIGLLYQVFVSITQVNLFDRETFTQITRNMYVVMGIAMLFIFAYNIVLMIINPDDKKSTGSTTKVVKETIISLVLVILLPTIFNWMYVFQNNIINSGIITSIILNNVGSNDNVDISCNYSDYGFDNYATYSGTGIIKGQGSFGVDNKIDEITQECNKFNKKTQKFKSLKGAYLVAPTILSAFYRPTNFTYDDCVTFVEQNHASGDFGTDDDKQICINYYYDVEYSKLSGDTSKFTKDKYLINSATDDTKEGMELNALFAIVSGVIAAIMYFSYCIEIGVRVAKLGVLQIVSPIAVMLRIVPKQKEAFFDKWFKNVKDTYLDVFIRLLIINFALFAVSLIPGVIKTLFSSIGDIDSNGAIKALATVFIILGILQFGKECPDLIKEFFGNSGRFSVKGGLNKLRTNSAQVGGALGTTAAVGGHIVKDWFSPKAWGNVGKNWKEAKGVKKAGVLLKTPINPLRHISQITGAVIDGAKSGGNSKSFSELRENVYTAASRQMAKPTIGQKITGFISDERDAFVGYYGANFSAFDSKHAEEKAKKLDEVNATLKKIEDYLDNKDPVKAINSTYEGLIKQAQDSGVCNNVRASDNPEAYSKEMEKLYKKWNEDRNRARGRISQELLGKNDEQLKNYLDSYRSIVKKNISIVNESLKVAEKPLIKDVDIDLSNSNFSEVRYNDARQAGKTSGDHAKAIRENIIAEQKKAGNK